MLELKDVTKSYGRSEALSGLDLPVAPGQIVALTGPSGAGKTTTLHIAAGVLAPTKGTISLDGRDITKVPAWKRDMSLVQETYALYPHLTVYDNIAFPLRSPKTGERVPEAEIERRIQGVAEVLEIGRLLKSRIQHLSGGQRQRVALGRALVREPRAFLLDEPIAHLDAKLRHWLRGELRRRLVALGRPCVWATPDGKEALSVADRVAVIIHGKVAQFGEPRDVFLNPATARVAEIVSEPPISLLNARVDPDGGRLWLEGVPDPLPLEVRQGEPARGEVVAGVRPSSLRMGNGSRGHRTRARVMAREFTNRETIVSVRLGPQPLRVLTHPFSEFQVDEEVSIEWDGARVYLFQPEGERRLLNQSQVVRSA